MSKQEEYIKLQAEWVEKTGLKPGDKVRLLVFPTKEDEASGYTFDWEIKSLGAHLHVGLTGTAGYRNGDDVRLHPVEAEGAGKSEKPHLGIIFHTPDGFSFWLPFFLLQKIDATETE